MAKSFRCKVITPESLLLNEPVTSVTLPLWDGLAGVLPNRAPMVAKLGMGELKIEFASQASPKAAEGGMRSFYIEEGFMQMSPAAVSGTDDAAAGGVLTILTTRAIEANKLVEAEVRAELAAAEAKEVPVGDAAAAEGVRKERERARRKLTVAQASRGR
jgi:F-type H+-transporting ATPase subunit epsilon